MKTEMLWNEIFRLKERGVSESQDARLEEGITGGCGHSMSSFTTANVSSENAVLLHIRYRVRPHRS